MRDMMFNARSLILVDDEASTGKTFINLRRALREAGLDKIQRTLTCVLTDWSAGAAGEQMDAALEQIALLRGSYTFHEDRDAPLPLMPEVGTVASGHWPLCPARDWGRLGVLDVDDSLAPDLQIQPGARVLVVGTGEFVWRPFLLAERLERAGADVHFSATSRSPIAVGHAIEHALSFSDNYGLGIPNFLYNVRPGQFERVLICTETPAHSVAQSLRETLNAEVICDET
jgi:hypothetical protein